MISMYLFVCLISSLPFSLLLIRSAGPAPFSSGIATPHVYLSPQVPVALPDSLHSVANGTRVNLAPTHKQHAAHPSYKPASIPAIAHTQCRGRKCVWIKALQGFAWTLWILVIPGVCLTDTQQVVEAEGRYLSKLLPLSHGENKTYSQMVWL